MVCTVIFKGRRFHFGSLRQAEAFKEGIEERSDEGVTITMGLGKDEVIYNPISADESE